MAYEIEPSSAAHHASIDPAENFIVASWDDLFKNTANGDVIIDGDRSFNRLGTPERTKYLRDMRQLRRIHTALFDLASLDEPFIAWEGDPIALPEGLFPLQPLQGARRKIPRTAVGYIEADRYNSDADGVQKWSMTFDIEAQVGQRKKREDVESIDFFMDAPGTARPHAGMCVYTEGSSCYVRPLTPTWYNGIARAKDFLQYATDQYDRESIEGDKA